MKKNLTIFAFSDIHSPDDFVMAEIDPSKIDLVVTLGDIPDVVLDYILYQSRKVPCFGVPGNHDKKHPAGLNNLHGRVVDFHGIKIGGIGGSRKYKNEPHHYTVPQMKWITRRLPAADLILAHSPPLGTSQKEDPLHQGFDCFDRYIKRHKPQVWLHGHTGKKFTGELHETAVYGVNVRRPLTLEFETGRIKNRRGPSGVLASLLSTK